MFVIYSCELVIQMLYIQCMFVVCLPLVVTNTHTESVHCLFMVILANFSRATNKRRHSLLPKAL